VKLGCLQFVQDGDLKPERAAEMTVEVKKVTGNALNQKV